MPLTQLNKHQLHGAILAGCQSVIKQKERLNQINVFPIADADTGDNMASTANAIIKFSSVHDTLKLTMNSVADAGILGARGNSGIIFSQFFNAWAEAISTETHLTMNCFSQLLLKSAHQVRSAIPNPVDGTLLTIIEAWASFTRERVITDCFDIAISELLPLLEKEVQKTASTLPVLKELDIVDAGALAFYYFISGFSHFLQHPEQELCVDENTLLIKTDHPAIPSSKIPEYRYCTEAVIKATTIDVRKLTSQLEHHGDCALVASNERLSHLHVHTNDPLKLFTALMSDFTVQYPKIDDMLRQFQTHHDRQYSIALLTDSSADIPQSLLDEYQIHQISLNIHLDEHQLLDRYCLDSNDFYHRLKHLKSYPKTSYPTPVVIRDKIKLLANHYDHVLVISLSKGMSGIYDHFNMAARSIANVTVIDSKTNSAAHGLLLHYAGQLIRSGMNIDKIINAIHKAIETTYIFVVVDQFDSMLRSGRMNKLKVRIAKFVKVKPIISIDTEGKGFVCGTSFSLRAAFESIINRINTKAKKENLTLQEYAIVHAGAEAKAIEFSNITTSCFKRKPEYIDSVSLAIGLHAGQGCVALAVRLKQSNE
jgi:DegV family protein with EDD domain